jgi:thioredoxin reductase (NADPH)
MAARANSHEKIDFIWDTVVEEAIGETHLSALKLRNIVDGSTFEFDADALFIAIGHTPNTEIFRGQLDLDQTGYIVSPDGVSTNVEGVFVAGDVNDLRCKQAVIAAGAGCRAAMDAEKFLEAMEFEVSATPA